MTEPEQQHTEEPAEGAVQPGSDAGGGRTPHPQQPAEGDPGTASGGADTPSEA